MTEKSNKLNTKGSQSRKLRVGFFVFGTLLILKVVEYAVSKIVQVGDWPYLIILAVGSASLIIYYYKHIRQLWSSEGEDDK